MQPLETVAPAFVEMAHQIVWASVATVDRRDRPRSRVLHPIWQWDGSTLRGWIATGPTPLKRAHIDRSPHLSVAQTILVGPYQLRARKMKLNQVPARFETEQRGVRPAGTSHVIARPHGTEASGAFPIHDHFLEDQVRPACVRRLRGRLDDQDAVTGAKPQAPGGCRGAPGKDGHTRRAIG